MYVIKIRIRQRQELFGFFLQIDYIDIGIGSIMAVSKGSRCNANDYNFVQYKAGLPKPTWRMVNSNTFSTYIF